MIRKLRLLEIEPLYRLHILPDFQLESPPMDELKKMVENDCLDVLSFQKNGKEKGYAICLVQGDYMALLFFAAYEGCRGQGIGTQFILELKDYYKGKEIIIEVESLACSTGPEEDIIINRRISFYEDLGFQMVPGIREWLNGYIYHVMTLPAGAEKGLGKEEAVEILEGIYHGAIAGFVREFKMEADAANV